MILTAHVQTALFHLSKQIPWAHPQNLRPILLRHCWGQAQAEHQQTFTIRNSFRFVT